MLIKNLSRIFKFTRTFTIYKKHLIYKKTIKFFYFRPLIG